MSATADEEDLLMRESAPSASASSTSSNYSTPSASLLKRILPRSRATQGLAVLACVVVGGLYNIGKFYSNKLAIIRAVSLLPVAVCLYVSFSRRRPRQRRPWYQSIIPLTLVATVVCSQLPLFLAAALAGAAVVCFALATLPPQTIPQVSKQKSQRRRESPISVLLATVVLVTVLLTENFMIWVVSATFPAGQSPTTAPPPLQDNGQRLLSSLLAGIPKTDVIGLRRLWNVQWSLVACMGASFVVTDVFLPHRSLYAMGTRAVLTLASARCIRTVSFLLTVVPSQSRHCYGNHFPYPPPSAWDEWLYVGLLPNSHGGCNDLIISGHATVTSTMASIATSVADDVWFSGALWTLVAMDYAVEIYEGFHYSVDMWLGMVLVWLFWRVLHTWEPQEASSSLGETEDGHDDSSAVAKITRPSSREILVYSLPGLLAYLQLVVLPKRMANFVIFGYIVFAVGVFVKYVWKQEDALKQSTYQHYAQHTILCLLYLALGVYL